MQRHLNVLVNLILQTYFADQRCIILFNDNTNFWYNGSVPIISVMVGDNEFDASVVFQYHGCQGFVFNADNASVIFEQLEDYIRLSMERFNYRKYLFMPTANNNEKLLGIFDKPQLEFVTDLLVIQASSADWKEINYLNKIGEDVTFEIKTHRFVGFNETGTTILVLDKWYSNNQSFLYESNLYPDKLHNGMGRTFKIATFNYKPYSVPDHNEGTELQLALEFTKRLNLTPVYVIDEEGEWGEIYDNWTGYGILGNVLNDNGDVGLAALYTWAHEYGFLDLSKPLVRTGVTCLTPAPTLAEGWLVPLFSFTYEMWTAVAISFLVCAVTLFALDLIKKWKFGTDNYWTNRSIFEESILETAAIFLLQSVSDERILRSNIKKYFYGSIFLFSLLLATTYSSGLASSMTVPRYEGAIKTVQELADSGIQWGATSTAWIMSIQSATEPNYVALLEKFMAADFETLTGMNNKRFAFSVERLPAGQFAIGEYITEKGVKALRLMTEDIYWEQCVLMTRKSSVWLPLIDEFILRIAQTGLAQYWEYKVATTHLNAKIQRTVAYSKSHEETSDGPTTLKWAHVQGAFALLFIGFTLSIICFICECSKKTIGGNNH